MPITGAAADFAISILGPAGDVATTGVTITEPDAAGNPGTYMIVADPLTSFIGTPGQYAVKAYTPANERIFVETLIVTRDAVPATYLDGGAFHASVGDGRITDGTNPLAGVVVTLLDSSNQVAYQSLTDSDGLWAAILDDGTYSITLNLSGYTRATANLTMTGGTGALGSDISMVASATSSFTASTLFSYTRRQMGDSVGNKANAQIEEVCNAALRTISRDLSDHAWWETDGTVTLRADYTLGNISVSDGSTTVTTSETLPSWAADAEIDIDGTWYFISSRDTDNQLTLQDAFLGEDQVAAPYQLVQVLYAMPADLQQVGGVVFYKDTWPYGAEPAGYETLQRAKHTSTLQSNKLWAAHGASFAIWPPVDEDSVARFLYSRAPAALSYDAPTAIVDIDPLLIDVVESAIDVQLLRRGLYSGDENPRTSYEAALKSSRTAASKRSKSRAGMGGRRSSREARLSYNQRG